MHPVINDLAGCRTIRWLALLVLLAASLSVPAQTLLVIGDSLSDGYGVPPGSGWVALLGDRLAKRTAAWRVVNASVSGDTTTGGAARIDAALAAHAPRVVVVELGGNDALRGQPIALMHENLSRIIERCREAGARVLLLGMRIPPNYGPAYTEAFHGVFQRLAESTEVPLVAFFLEGVALDGTLMQSDGIHPTEQAQPIMLENVWPYLEPLIADVEHAE